MNPICRFTSKTVILPMTDIDTDQIIPARFLTTTVRQGLGKHCFADWRFKPDGSLDPESPLNKPENAGRSILIAGANFGCGSSREHAPWALLDLGFQAVASTQIADIFRSNAARNGLLPIIIDPCTHAWLLAHPDATVTIDLAERTLSVENGPTTTFPFDKFQAFCLIQGIDEIEFLLNHTSQITQYEESHS